MLQILVTPRRAVSSMPDKEYGEMYQGLKVLLTTIIIVIMILICVIVLYHQTVL